MNINRNKTWLHPVLRPQPFGDDYIHGEFSADITMDGIQNGTAVKLLCKFEIDVKEIYDLIDHNMARCALLVQAGRTWHRELLFPSEDHDVIDKQYSAGDLAGRVRLLPFVVSVSEVQGFKSINWHPDYGDMSFDFTFGSVLAHDVTRTYYVDPLPEGEIASIFQQICSEGMEPGRWEMDFQEERIFIVMSQVDSEKFVNARNRAIHNPNGAYLLNGIYLPALVAALDIIDKNPEEYQDCRWFPSLVNRMEQVGCSPLGTETNERVSDAQKMLGDPYPIMPIIAQEGS